MTVSNYDQWVNDGRPWKPASPVSSVANMLRAHGYTVYILGDYRHLTADPPEDHTPYSHTPWPGAQPYPNVMAEDIMPGGEWSLEKLGAKIYQDKQDGNPELACLKYMNWTDSAGNCWHDRWTPNHQRTPSSDKGHIHLSFRTDYVTKTSAYNPFVSSLKEYVMDVDLDGYKLPTVHKGTDDSKMKAYKYVFRIQSLLNLTLNAGLKEDGVYGDATAAAVRRLPTNSDGNSVGLAEWVTLYGLVRG